MFLIFLIKNINIMRIKIIFPLIKIKIRTQETIISVSSIII